MKLTVDFFRNAIGIACGGTFPGALLQRLLRCQPGNVNLMRILIAEFVQAEFATISDLLRAGDSVRMAGKQAHHFFRRLKLPHSRSFAAIAEFVDGATFTNAGQHVLEDMSSWRMVQHVIGGNGRHAHRPGGIGNGAQAGRHRWGGASVSRRHRPGLQNPLSSAADLSSVGSVQRMPIKSSAAAARSAQYNSHLPLPARPFPKVSRRVRRE